MLPPPGRQGAGGTKGSPGPIMREVDGCRIHRRHLSSVTSPPRSFVVFPLLINGRVVFVAVWRQ